MRRAHFVKYAIVLTMLVLVMTGCPQSPVVQPAPDFRWNPGEGTAPLNVRFEDASIPGSTPIQAWWWDFGDGGTSTNRNPDHVYKVPGAYAVTLVVTTSEGNFSTVKESAVTVQEQVDFGGLDEFNRFVSQGIEIALPEAYSGAIKFGVLKDTVPAPIDGYTPLDVLSSTYTIRHNQDNPELFVYGEDGLTRPATLSIALLDPLPPLSGPITPAQALARLEDGRTVPIPGDIVGGNFVASVLRLPSGADYVVVRRTGMIVSELRAENMLAEKDAVPGEGWSENLVMYSDPITESILTALYQGSMSDEDTFYRRNFSSTVVEKAILRFTRNIQQAHFDLAASGVPAPTLVTGARGYVLNLFTMFPSYSYDMERATDVMYYDNFFGHLVLDPAQLIAITIRNLRIAAGDEDAVDYSERFYPQSAFAESLIQSVYPSCALPRVTTTGNTALALPIPADRTPLGQVKPISFLQGFLDGGALYFGRKSLEYGARGFGDNEHGILANSAFFPYSEFVPGYGYAGHEFLAWLEESYSVDDALSVFASGLNKVNGEYADIARQYTRPLNFREALTALYRAMDGALAEDLTGAFPTLADAYWEFAKDYAYLNGQNAILRPSDGLRSPFSLNAARFDDHSLLQVSLGAAEETVVLTPDANEALRNIPAMAMRAIVFDLHPTTTTLEIALGAPALKAAGDGDIRIAVYQDGQSGVEFSQAPGNIRNYVLLDTNADGKTDTIQIWQLGCEGNPCENRVILLAANLEYAGGSDLPLTVTGQSNLTVPEQDVLARYVHAYEPLYEYNLEQTLDYGATEGYKAFMLSMTSGTWRSAKEVYETEWRHDLVVIEPNNINKSTAMLFVAGGGMDTKAFSSEDEAMLGNLALLARASRSAVAMLTMVPNQPLTFKDEEDSRIEDAILAYSFNKYMERFDDGSADPAWPVLLPMTRAVVRGIDTLQDFMLNKPGPVRDINSIVVAGAYNRGWATWLAGVVDERVSAIVPMMTDALNLDKQMEHHRKTYASYPSIDVANGIFGGYSAVFRDYVGLGIFDRLGSAAGRSLLRIIDPYRYILNAQEDAHILSIPKLIANSAGDPYYPPDSSRFYYNDIGGTNYLHYSANTAASNEQDSGFDDDTLAAIGAFYLAQVRGTLLPTYEWEYNAATTEITVRASEEPEEVLLWTANAPLHRDFRLKILKSEWESLEVVAAEDGSYNAVIGTPGSGWRAGLMQIRFAADSGDDDGFLFTTPVWITPDEYPAP